MPSEAWTSVNAYDYLQACGFTEVQTVTIVLHALLRTLDIDLDTLRASVVDAGFGLVLTPSGAVAPDHRERN